MMSGNLSGEEEIKRYLYRELSEDEAERFEERLFEDNDYFYDVLATEDDLVDRYALGKLSGAERARFEKSLAASPARREKLASAVALQRRIAEERRAASARETATKRTLWERLASLFSARTHALRFAAVGLMVLLAVGVVFLSVERIRLESEIARLRDSESRQREDELEKQVAAAREREDELKRKLESESGKLESESGKSEVISEQLESETAERARIQRELDALKHVREAGATPTTMAFAFLLVSGGRGNGDGDSVPVTVGKNVERIVISLKLKDELAADALYSVEIKGRSVANALRPKRTRSGKLLVTFNVPAQKVDEGKSSVTLKDEAGHVVGDYELNVKRR